MKRAIGVAGLAMVVAAQGCGLGAPAPPVEAADYAFVGASVIPMSQEGVIEDQTVLVSGETIVHVGNRDATGIPEGTQVIESSGRYLMPGLAEMHAHVPPQPDPPREVLEDIMFLYIANGVTTIRGMLGAPYQIELAEELARGDMLGPTFYHAAPSLNGATAPDPETAESLVRAHHEAGYHLLKIHPGIGMPAWDRLTEVASEVGISFAGHIPADVGLTHALNTGQTCIDHLDGYVEAIEAPELERRLNSGEAVPLEEIRSAIGDDVIDGLVQQTVDAGAYVVPTMYLWDNLYNDHDPESMVALPEMQYVSQAQRDAWIQQARNNAGTPPAVGVMVSDTRRRILKALSDAGAGILMGTDSPQLYNVPGFALHREIRIYEEAGMSRHQVLESGTTTVAEYVDGILGLDGNFGTVAPGQRADLILLDRNPLDALDNLEARAGVMVRGQWISGEQIEAGLSALAAKHAAAGG